MPPRPRLYLDNAATSFPKPPEVAQAMLRYMNDVGASAGRGAYAEAVAAGRILTRCRDLLAKLINAESGDRIVFTLNASDALNLAIKGIARHWLQRGEKAHLITTDLDHNSVLRPINELAAAHREVEVTRIPFDPATGVIDPDEVRDAITPHTRLVATLHASNVLGTIQPIEAIAELCRQRDVLFLLDAAQTLGHVPIDVRAVGIDLLAFPGHKGLLGPLGTGGLYVRPGVEKLVEPLREGGTGTISESDRQPATMPERYEPGSHNAPGIAGLAAGVQWLLERGVESLREHEQRLTARLLQAMAEMPGTRVLGPLQAERRCGVISFTIEGIDPPDLAAILEENYGILARSGLHCAPHVHRVCRTAGQGGAVRLSVGPFVTDQHVQGVCEALADVAHEQAVSGSMSHA